MLQLRCQHSLRLMWLWICACDRNKNSVATDFQWQAHYFRGIKSLRQPRSGPTHFHSIPISNTWHQKTNKTTLPCCTPHSITNYNVVIDTISLEIPSSATSAMHFPMTTHPICQILSVSCLGFLMRMILGSFAFAGNLHTGTPHISDSLNWDRDL